MLIVWADAVSLGKNSLAKGTVKRAVGALPTTNDVGCAQALFDPADQPFDWAKEEEQ